jgi:vitamin B12 transporter
MSQLSPYVSLINKNNGFTGEADIRWNHHSEYGSNFTYTINPSYLINNKIKLFANLYSAFKTPTLYQLFDPSAGNADLKSEKGTITEAGAELFSSKAFRIRAVGFYRNTKNAIQYILIDPVFFISQYRNVSRQKNYGAELEINYALNKWNIAANYTYTDGKTKSDYDGTGAPLGKDTTYYNLYRIPKNDFNINIGWQATTELFISTQLRAIGKREEFIYGAAPETLKSYATIDLYGEYKFNRKIKAFADLKNITNKEYFDIPGYNSRKFNFITGVSFNL